MARGAAKLDYEVEFAVVIGRQCMYLADAAAVAEVIARFTIANDISERAFQLERNGQWFKGKSALTFNPCGPFLATSDEVACSQLDIWLDVKGERRQSSSTSKMIFVVYEIVRYMSQFVQLEPGDLINIGTPSGVGLGMQPPTYLQVGDEMRLGVSSLGEQRCTVAPAGYYEIASSDGSKLCLAARPKGLSPPELPGVRGHVPVDRSAGSWRFRSKASVP